MTINLTDPANQPANSPLTGERIERVIEALESSLKYRNGSSMDHFIADAVKGLRELRVSREALPVIDADLLHASASAIEDLLTTKDRSGTHAWNDMPAKLRKATQRSLNVNL
ncbi:hypothetical protein [Kluyvera ascorbata]|uniref:hypothetical protein n=1 Tax=Kluyvera ascorbata TaxID=51288 RepID=UPI002804508E|nr:hypothetical protein [Kluyvera ascorbata]MDU3911563.1 hypothetical protein [Kluyvera ascorbata]